MKFIKKKIKYKISAIDTYKITTIYVKSVPNFIIVIE